MKRAQSAKFVRMTPNHKAGSKIASSPIFNFDTPGKMDPKSSTVLLWRTMIDPISWPFSFSMDAKLQSEQFVDFHSQKLMLRSMACDLLNILAPQWREREKVKFVTRFSSSARVELAEGPRYGRIRTYLIHEIAPRYAKSAHSLVKALASGEACCTVSQQMLFPLILSSFKCGTPKVCFFLVWNKWKLISLQKSNKTKC